MRHLTKIPSHILWGDLNQVVSDFEVMLVHLTASVPSVSRDMSSAEVCIIWNKIIALFSSFPFYFILYSLSTEISPVHRILYSNVTIILCVNNVLLVPSPQFVYKLHILFRNIFQHFMAINRIFTHSLLGREGHLDPLPSNSCVNRRRYNNRC
jgi:hypothetical protein